MRTPPRHPGGLLLLALTLASTAWLHACGEVRTCGCGDLIAVDGSSTVYPITEAVAEEFGKTGGGLVTIGVSGTGGGFKKLCAGHVAVIGASRPMRPSEKVACAEHGIEVIELPVAYDGIAVVVHPDNGWADTLTVDELRRMWEPSAQGKVLRWNQIRPGWPNRELHLFGPGIDSGTYDYFTEAVVGKSHESRGDYTSTEDDNVLVQGVWRDRGALGFFGFAYYAENRDKVRAVPVAVQGGRPVAPTRETIADGSYRPLSRPVFIYVDAHEAERPEIRAFVRYWLDHGAPLTREVGYVPLPEDVYAMVRERFERRQTGSVFAEARPGASVREVLGGR